MNSITIAGNLGRDAELRSMQDGTRVAAFSLADSQGREKPTIWWSCSIFGKRAESLASYLVKGAQVTVSGNVTQREYTDKDGNKRTSMDVRVNDIALQGGKREGAAQPAGEKPAAKPSSGFDDLDEDPIPF